MTDNDLKWGANAIADFLRSHCHFCLDETEFQDISSVYPSNWRRYAPVCRGQLDGHVVAPRLLNRQRAAKYCGVCVNTFIAHVASHVRPVEIGAKRLWDMRELDRWIDARSKGMTEPAQADWPARLDEDDRSRERR
jgi:hypothetical protein